MKTMISNLPKDLIEEILSRVPLKSMRSVRLTCTKWNALSKSQSFTKMHIDNAPAGESQMIVMMDYKFHLMSVVVNGDPEPKSKVISLEEQVEISKVFHSEGLLLCILKENDTKVLVWNPYCGQKTWIEIRFSQQGRRLSRWLMEKYKYAIGYAYNNNNKSCRSHKILRAFDDLSDSPTPEGQFLWYEIYDLDSGLWTTLDVSPCVTLYGSGVSLKGNTYWCASEKISAYENKREDHIICFDFTSERFGPLMRMPFTAGADNESVTLSCVREEKLAVMRNDKNDQIRIWITTKIVAEEISWSKFLTLKTNAILPGCFFIDEEKKIAMGYHRVFSAGWNHTLSIIGEGGYLRKLDLGEVADENYWGREGSSYASTLVQLKQRAGGERKRQSDLEKRRYDEKMSKFVALE